MPYTEAVVPLDEEHIFDGKVALVVGGASGTGEAITRALALRGAQVLFTSRSPEKLEQMQRASSFSQSLLPLVLDVTKTSHIRQIKELLDNSNIQPDFLVLSSAGGLEKLMRPILKYLINLKRLKPAERADKLKEFDSFITQQIEQHQVHQHAIAVNFQGNVNVFEALVPHLAEGAEVVYISSGPSSFAEISGIPSFYHWVAYTKRMFELHLAGRSVQLSERGIRASIVTGGLLADTKMGELLITGLSFLGDNHLFPDGYEFPTTADMAKAATEVLGGSHRVELGIPYYRYVVGRGDIQDQVDPHDPRINFPRIF